MVDGILVDTWFDKLVTGMSHQGRGHLIFVALEPGLRLLIGHSLADCRIQGHEPLSLLKENWRRRYQKDVGDKKDAHCIELLVVSKLA